MGRHINETPIKHKRKDVMTIIDAASSHWSLSSNKVSVRQNADNGEYDMLVWCPSLKMSTRRLWRSSFRTDGQSNNDIRPHRCRTQTVQSYSPCGTNVHLHLIHGFLGPPESTFQTASRSVQPFLQGSRMVDIQSPTAEIGRGNERRKIETTGQKYNGLPYYIGRP